ncbi:helix-turn-helix domain-containing protein [Dyadobacter jiangsuensis]|uniref:Cro/C1-type helix-turn-helix DNA-binding protein n=1 Tax=Dyadobacter jiangsuensis TaxID=1591085 RepID=A0A2P8FAC4_9BACT|nr:Cro/C1-type helix-turn-helix DNA-binding protein [Dyadobacter jiangsuensis]
MAKITELEQYVIDRVKARRLELGISQKELAHLLNASEGWVGLVESTKTDDKYSLRRINDLAKILNCSPKDFLPDSPF